MNTNQQDSPNGDLAESLRTLHNYGDNIVHQSFSLDLGKGGKKKLEIIYDSENQYFKIYQKGRFGKEDISSKTLHQLEKITKDHGYSTQVLKRGDKNYFAVDAQGLASIFDHLGINQSDGLRSMMQKEKTLKTNLVQDCCERLGRGEDTTYADQLSELFHENRVFLDRDKQGNPCWTACIDATKGTYLSATPEELPTLVGYLQGDYYLRRKKELPIQVFPLSKLVQKREFRTNTDADQAKIKLIFDGADDTASALTSSGLPQQTINAIQSLLVFPVFLALVEIGIAGMSEGLEESSEHIVGLKKTIADCKDQIRGLEAMMGTIGQGAQEGLSAAEESELMEKLKECVIPIAELQDHLAALSEEKMEQLATRFGHPGMLMMFNGLLGYELQSFLNLAGGVPILSKGFEGTAVGAKFGQDPQLPLGLTGIAGNGSVFVGQLLMTVFATINTVKEAKSIREINEEIAELQLSDTITDVLKKEVVAFKKDERLFAAQRLAGSAMLGVGQGTMAVSGPVGLAFNPGVYAGLVLTLMGVGLCSASQLREIKLFSYNDQTTGLEKAILSKTQSEIMKMLLEDLKTPAAQYDANAWEQRYTEIGQKATYQLEVLNHLQKVPLVTQKLFKSTRPTTDLESAKHKGEKHYQSRRHQEGLLHTLEGLELPQAISNILTNNSAIPQDSEDLHFMKKTCVLYDITEKLEPKPQDLVWMQQVAEFLRLKNSPNQSDSARLLGQCLEACQQIPEVPSAIKQCLGDSCATSISSPEMIQKLQKAYVGLKLADYDPVRLYADKDEAQLKRELSQRIMNSEKSGGFEKRLLDDTYNKKEKKRGGYKPTAQQEAAIHIVGTLTKKDKGRFRDKIHKKKVYTFNEQSLNHSFRPKNKTFQGYVYGDRKFAFRSDYFRSLHHILDGEPQKIGAAALELLQKKGVDPITTTPTAIGDSGVSNANRRGYRSEKNSKKSSKIGPKNV